MLRKRYSHGQKTLDIKHCKITTVTVSRILAMTVCISKDRKKNKYFPYEQKNATQNDDVILDRNAFFTQNSFRAIKGKKAIKT